MGSIHESFWEVSQKRPLGTALPGFYSATVIVPWAQTLYATASSGSRAVCTWSKRCLLHFVRFRNVNQHDPPVTWVSSAICDERMPRVQARASRDSSWCFEGEHYVIWSFGLDVVARIHWKCVPTISPLVQSNIHATRPKTLSLFLTLS